VGLCSGSARLSHLCPSTFAPEPTTPRRPRQIARGVAAVTLFLSDADLGLMQRGFQACPTTLRRGVTLPSDNLSAHSLSKARLRVRSDPTVEADRPSSATMFSSALGLRTASTANAARRKRDRRSRACPPRGLGSGKLAIVPANVRPENCHPDCHPTSKYGLVCFRMAPALPRERLRSTH
jgi:hypothetical protein